MTLCIARSSSKVANDKCGIPTALLQFSVSQRYQVPSRLVQTNDPLLSYVPRPSMGSPAPLWAQGLSSIPTPPFSPLLLRLLLLEKNGPTLQIKSWPCKFQPRMSFISNRQVRWRERKRQTQKAIWDGVDTLLLASNGGGEIPTIICREGWPTNRLQPSPWRLSAAFGILVLDSLQFLHVPDTQHADGAGM
jgi:hypothetical protein